MGNKILNSQSRFTRHAALTLLFSFNAVITSVEALSINTIPKIKLAVWDNVLSEESRDVLHGVAKEEGMGHKVFTRPLSSSGNNPEIEIALDDILTKLEDNSKYVEYWTRQEWRSIEAHADVDEFLAKKDDADNNPNAKFRYPRNGHVLYLQVGIQVRGPTCLFPDRISGGDLLRSDGGPIELVTVPAVPGRLLRFKGDYLHAVPRPADLWLLKFVRGGPQFTPESEWGRSVILFNTWGDNPPLDVPFGMKTEGDYSNSKECLSNKLSDWSESFVLLEDDEICLNTMTSQEKVPAKVWLLGNERRRNHQMRTLKLAAPESIREALHEEKDVTRLVLEQI